MGDVVDLTGLSDDEEQPRRAEQPSLAQLNAERVARQRERDRTAVANASTGSTLAPAPRPTPSTSAAPPRPPAQSNAVTRAPARSSVRTVRDWQTESYGASTFGGAGRTLGGQLVAGLREGSARVEHTRATRYFDGAIVHTRSCTPGPGSSTSDGASLEDILNVFAGQASASRTRSVVLSSFTTDVPWLMNYLHPLVPSVCVMQAYDENDPRQLAQKHRETALMQQVGSEPHWIVMPSTGNPYERGCMHAKFILVFQPTYCRIAISTANLYQPDWGIHNNTLYVRDFPVRQGGDPFSYETTAFTRNFFEMLDYMGVAPEYWRDHLGAYDFSSASDVHLVLSRPGTWRRNEALRCNGFTTLADGIRQLVPKPGGTWHLEYQSSSISTVSFQNAFLTALLNASRGVTPFDGDYQNMRSPQNNAEMLFPTRDYARQQGRWPEDSIPGMPRGSAHFCTEAVVDKSGGSVRVGAPMLRQAESRMRHGDLIHGKYLVITHNFERNSGERDAKRRKIDDAPVQSTSRGGFGGATRGGGGGGRGGGTALARKTGSATVTERPSAVVTASDPEAFIFVGSHNATSAAWGTVTGTGDQRRTRNLSWELGVVLRVPGRTEDELNAHINKFVTYRRPAPRYASDDVPWIAKQNPYPNYMM